MRAPSPRMVRAPWRSRPSWPLRSRSRFDPLADVAEAAVAARFVAAIRAQESGAVGGHELLELGAGEVLVGDDRVSGDWDAVEQFGGTTRSPMLAAATSQPIGIPSAAQIT